MRLEQRQHQTILPNRLKYVLTKMCGCVINYTYTCVYMSMYMYVCIYIYIYIYIYFFLCHIWMVVNTRVFLGLPNIPKPKGAVFE